MEIGELVINTNPEYCRVTNSGVICQIMSASRGSKHTFGVRIVEPIGSWEQYEAYCRDSPGDKGDSNEIKSLIADHTVFLVQTSSFRRATDFSTTLEDIVGIS